ncbi:hypothetical protein BH23GEM9_BH23GEM9_07040 [soil metagenome]
MTATPATGRKAAFAVVLLYGLVFLALSIDVMARVVDWRTKFEAATDFIVLLYFEGMRALIVASGIAVAILAMQGGRRHPALRWLSLGVGLLTVSVAKALTGALPGAAQEAAARALLGRGVPPSVLAVVFAHPEWTAWLALPPLLLFATAYPRPLDAADVHASGGADRRGALRSTRVAGADVGSLARSLTARLIEHGWLRGASPWLAALVLGATHTAALRTTTGAARISIMILAAAIALLAVAVLMTALRAGFFAAEAPEKRPLTWLRRGALCALSFLAFAAAAELIWTGPVSGASALFLAPLALLACTAVAVLQTPPYGGRASASISAGAPLPGPRPDWTEP